MIHIFFPTHKTELLILVLICQVHLSAVVYILGHDLLMLTSIILSLIECVLLGLMHLYADILLGYL